MSDINLHLGCGKRIMKDWQNIDKYSDHPQALKYPIENLPYETGSVSHIYTSHMIEHVHQKILADVLNEWNRVLKTDGKLIIRCPYAPLYLEKWLSWSVEDRLNTNCILGMQNLHDGMLNRNLFCEGTLAHWLNNANFKIVEMKRTTIRTTQLYAKLAKGELDDGYYFPNTEKADLFCVAIKG